MFYDLEDPVSFMKEKYSLLDDNGVWICEQSYMPEMLKQTHMTQFVMNIQNFMLYTKSII